MRGAIVVGAVVASAGCGRIGFDVLDHDAGDDASTDRDGPDDDAPPAPPTPPGAVLVFHFDEPSGTTTTSADGAIVGDVVGPMTRKPGIRGSAMGIVNTAYVDVPQNPALAITGALSISLWYRLDRVPMTSECIPTLIHGSSATGPSGNVLYSINLYSPTIIYYSERLSQQNNGSSVLLPAAGFMSGIWHHLVLTRDATGPARFYLDGGPSIALPVTGMVDSGAAGHLRIGADLEPSVCMTFPGTLDELYIYPRTLSAAEVQQLFDAR